jgi:glutathione S-transferase
MMKLFFHPVSTVSRPVVLFLAEANIPYEPVLVDMMTGAHLKEPYVTMNPSHMLPALEDEGFVLTESSAILKYIADKHGSAAYPKDLKARARVNERMDWINTNFYREYGYHFIYPQVLPNHKRDPEAAQAALLEWGKSKSEHWLEIFDKTMCKEKYLCGAQITIADYFGAELLCLGDVIGVSFKRFPNVDRWLQTMRALPNWKKVNEAVDGWAASMKGKPFVTISA